MIKNELLGNITSLILNLRDHKIITDRILDLDLLELGLSWCVLKSNKAFIEGVWSAFIWDLEIERCFWNRLISSPSTDTPETLECPKEAMELVA